MNNTIYPCIWMNGQAAEAASLYCSAFAPSQVEHQTPVVTLLLLKGKKIMLLNGGPDFRPNSSISFYAVCGSEKELDRAWETLSEGSRVMMPLRQYSWSEKYGWLEDKYGVSWQLTLDHRTDPGTGIAPSLLFTGEVNGQAEEAIAFYTHIFPNSSTELLARYEKDDTDTTGHLKHARFTLDGNLFTAMDSSIAHPVSFSEGVSLVVSAGTQEEINGYWQRLTEGGKEDKCGWLKDRFGISWQVVPSRLGALMADPERAPRVMNELLKMKKIDIATLENA